jgi:phthalate 4,5-dioxygenase
MGDLIRRYWIPAVTIQDVKQPDGAPVRLRIMGEDLVAFRDTQGRVGVVRAYCSHRLAPLFFGRNEECGLRCPYHGWKFNVDGECVETPNVEVGASAIRKAASILAYPVHEAGGLVWIYMGPPDKRPPFPALECAQLPEDQLYVTSWLQRSNWLQGLEGEVDSSHISWLHRDFDRENSPTRGTGNELADDGAPVMSLRETPYGFTYAARRALKGDYFWRMTQWAAPIFTMIPWGPGERKTDFHAWVPIDDNHVTLFSLRYSIGTPFSEDERKLYESGALFPPPMKKGSYQLPDGYAIDTYIPEATKENDYKIDRAMQRTRNYSGIWSLHDQDRSLQETSKPIDGTNSGLIDRSLEHLVSSDLPIVTLRRRLIKWAEELQKGNDPAALGADSANPLRAFSKICKIESFDDFLEEYGAEAGYIKATTREKPVESALY